MLLAEGDPEVSEDEERLVEEFRRQLELGLWAAVPTAKPGHQEAVMVRDFAESHATRSGSSSTPGCGRVSVDPTEVERRARAAANHARRGGLRRLRAPRVLHRPGRGDPASDTPTSSIRTGRWSPTRRHRRAAVGYCVRFRDDGRRLPDADDVLAKWLALNGRERELIATANVNPPGHQVDPDHVRRDLALLARWRSSAS